MNSCRIKCWWSTTLHSHMTRHFCPSCLSHCLCLCRDDQHWSGRQYDSVWCANRSHSNGHVAFNVVSSARVLTHRRMAHHCANVHAASLCPTASPSAMPVTPPTHSSHPLTLRPFASPRFLTVIRAGTTAIKCSLPMARENHTLAHTD